MSDQRFETKQEAAGRRIMEECGPRLMAMRAQMVQATGREPVAYMLPERYDPGPYDGADATDAPPQLMGLPIVWGPIIGLVFAA